MEPFEARVTPSLLDRLTDFAPSVREESPQTRTQGLRALKAALWRDLSALLNSKRRENEIPEQFVEAANSLMNYGLPDFSSYSLKNPADQNRLRRAIEAAIRRFEPRLDNVTVYMEQPSDTNPALHFRVDAMLRVDPASEPVSFDTFLQPENCRFVIMGADR